jgi:hypothetical protein
MSLQSTIHAGFYLDTPRTAIGQERALNGQGDPAADKALHLNGMSAFKSVTVSVSNADFPRQAQDRREKLTDCCSIRRAVVVN